MKIESKSAQHEGEVIRKMAHTAKKDQILS